jgi:hypothetical protein
VTGKDEPMNATTDAPTLGWVTCDNCGSRHPAQFSHLGQWDGARVFVVVCTEDGLEDFYRETVVDLLPNSDEETDR